MDVQVDTFFGRVTVPTGTSREIAEALGYLAWKGGIGEDRCMARFARWFRRLAERRPDLAEVHAHQLYPVDEFRYRGSYVDHYGNVRPKTLTNLGG